MFRHTLTAASAAVLALAVGVLAAGCSSAPPSPGVASLGSSTSATTTANNANDSGFQKALQFSACMRSHGVKNFPDPKQAGGGVQLQIGKNSGIDPQSPAFQNAQKACQKLMPGGGPKGGGTPFDPTKISAWTTCMRQHGLPNFPDPTNTGSGLKLDLTGTGIDPSKMSTALSACRPKFPGGTMQMTAGSGSGGNAAVGGGGGS